MSTDSESSEQSKHWLRTLNTARFVAVHLLGLAVFWTGMTWTAVILFAVLYSVRMFGVTAGYHRYFSHRTYKMGRVAQFIMAFIAESSAQKGVLWWASHHRHHHTHSDEPDDVHSPKQHGLWYAHVGWIFDPDWADTDDQRIKDLSRYPELVWIDRYHWLPPAIVGFGAWLIGGWPGLIVGFFWSTVACWHATFTINSLAHVIGSRRYETEDESKNHWLLALITFGEGWHNNHHHYQASANQGFYWWEYDLSYYALKGLSWVGVVTDLRNPPEHVIADEPHPKVLERRRKKEQEAAQADEETGGQPATEVLGGRVEQIGLSAARAQEEASRQVKRVRMAATTRVEEMSDEASRRYAEVSQAASEQVEHMKESARVAQEQAEQKVDRIVESLQKKEPSPETS